MGRRAVLRSWCRAQVIVLAVVLLIVGVSAVHPAKATGSSGSMAIVFGEVTWKDMYDNLHPMSWARVTIDDGVNPPVSTSSLDGWYSMVVPAGTYAVTVVSTSDFSPATVSGVVLIPGSSKMLNFDLELVPRPIPEMPASVPPLALMGALFVLFVSVRRVNVKRSMVHPS